MEQSPIQPKKQGNKKSNGGRGWGRWAGPNLKKEALGNIGVLDKIGSQEPSAK